MSQITRNCRYPVLIEAFQAEPTRTNLWTVSALCCAVLSPTVLPDSATPRTVARQGPLSMGFSRQEYLSGLPFPPPGDLPVPGIKPHLLHWLTDSLALSHLGSPIESHIAQSCPTLCNPMDCSLPCSSVHGFFQARVLEWVSISYSRGSSQSRD